jgi:hypothetical protein
MSVLYKGQDYRITLNTGVDLTIASETKVLYKKPGGGNGEWVSSVVTVSMYYDVTAADNDEDGVWQFQAYAEISGKIYFGSIVKQTILPNIL